MTDSDFLYASPIQRRLVLAAHLRPEDPSTNWALVSKLPPDTDPFRFAAAVASVVNENRAFTESFEMTDDMSVVVRRHGSVHQVPVVSYSSQEDVVRRATELGDTVYQPSGLRLFHAEVAVCGDVAYYVFAGSHAISDGFGYLQLIEDFAARYRDPKRVLPDLTSPAEIAETPARELDETISYFRSLFAGIADFTVPSLGRRDKQGRIPGSISRHQLGDGLYIAVGQLAATLGVRRYSVLVAALAVTASVITRTGQVVISTPMANRRASTEAAGTRGIRVNALPLRFDVDKQLSVADLAIVADTQIDNLLAFEQRPFSEFARFVVPGDGVDAAVPPVSFTLYPRPLAVAVNGVKGEVIHVDRRYLQQPLGVTVEVGDEAQELIVERADEIGHVDVAGMYEYILNYAVSDRGDQPIAELDWSAGRLTSRVERSCSFPVTTLDAAFATAVTEYRERTAVITDNEYWTFEELAAEASAVANWLNGTTEYYVAVSMPAGTKLVATMLGIFMARRVYIPIDPDNLAARLPQIAEACPGLTVLVAENDVATVEALGGDVVVLGLPPDLPPAPAMTNKTNPDDIAYIFFTSGSTGTPKGVQVTHAAAARFFDGLQAETEIGAARWLNLHSISFDISIVEILSAIFAGGTAVIPGNLVKRDPDSLARFVDRHSVQIMSVTASALSMYGNFIVGSESVTHIIQAGERLDFPALAPLADTWPGVTFFNAYGTTETVMYHTAYRLPRDPGDFPKESVIGRPFGDMSMEVVDDDLRVLPVGVPGELAVSGAGMMAGYLDREATARVLRKVNGRLLYLTGDRGYLDSTGQYIVIGRDDGQVKIRGHRCELGEVESACLRTGLVSVVCAMAVGNGLEAELICFAVPRDAADEADLRERLTHSLPQYSLPDRIFLRDALPMNTNGKVDRPALVRSYTRYGQRTVSAHDAGVQHAIERAWQTVLDGAEFDPDTRFFDAGGTSASVLRVRELLYRDLGREVDVVDLFEYCTPRALARFLSESSATDREDN